MELEALVRTLPRGDGGGGGGGVEGEGEGAVVGGHAGAHHAVVHPEGLGGEGRGDERAGEGVPEEGGAEAERVVAEDEARRGDVAERGVGEEQRAGEREGGGQGAGDEGGRVRTAVEEAAAAALVEAEDELVEGSGREGAGGNGRHPSQTAPTPPGGAGVLRRVESPRRARQGRDPKFSKTSLG